MSASQLNTTLNKMQKITSGSPELDAKIKEWLMWDKNKKTSDQIKNLVRNENFDHLREILMNRLSYGIEGFRGLMEAGYKRINDLFVIQCAQGILRYLEINELSKLKISGIVVGFDGRHNSKRFADLVTTVFIQKNYTVRLFNVVVPSYFVSYSVVKYGSSAGIMICCAEGANTENGLQIYDSSGAHVTYPVETEIEACINGNLEPNNSSWDTSILTKTDMKINPLTDMLKSYLDMITVDTLEEYRGINKKSAHKFVYTPLHGVGFIYMARAMETVHLQIVPVEEEKYPNADFTTEQVPDFRGEIKLEAALSTAQSNKVDYIIANNTDATRVVIAERHSVTGEFKFFNADETAILLAWWAYHVQQSKIEKNAKSTNLYMIGGIFNTKLTKRMARIDGFYYIESFGGKWLGNTMRRYRDEGKKVVFAYDDYGYIMNTSSFTKDGIHAGVALACLVNYLYHHGVTLMEHLEELYKQYGYYLSMRFCFRAETTEALDDVFSKLRNFRKPHTYPRGMAEGKYVIKYIRDYKEGLDTADENKRVSLPLDPNIDYIAFTFDNGMIGSIYNHKHLPSSLTLHVSICGEGQTSQKQTELKSTLTKMTYTFIEEFLDPNKNTLTMLGMEIPGIAGSTSNKCH